MSSTSHTLPPEHQASLIDGKAFAATVRQQIREDVLAFHDQHGVTPGLAVILVGNDPASEVYVKNKAIQTHHAGMRSFMHMLPETTSETELLTLIGRLNNDPEIHGILVQLPLPNGLDARRITNAILPEKDVDGLGEVNAGRLAVNLPGIVPCTPLGCLMLLRDQLGDMKGQHAVVIGASNLVGKPMALLLLAEGCTVTIAHIHTRDTAALAREADILVVATGCRELVRGDWIKPGATVIDVGITRTQTASGKSRLVGDVAFDEAVKIAGRITPVPGGVGPMTIACLLKNTLTAAQMQIEGKTE
ncbi:MULTISPECIES: bifunctional methylenetetrahydrofolate dehydrogenase/methenyltetrahydrofolate cyclohydrolase FolD [Acetobacter]|jgi:methylenetetrahydrofolate dehydrogenase (NADP+)/methenyltetrahydrofolate cyclohydrolase|uniref:Bifunctional protein FolD n=1 Tax=Acetobacter lovaniensis TaxID=104100 RepID=A0A841QFW9_9PROT|nr:bifunctional methylenetetrahydrofolate dehydrogenase/methenyltetrahydrofolate cyclohydrolase FolD [Acetobacter lovaniensis]MBB6457318.1 methylenetetrahydrofolate dehydrogenase (NADP+)/methenyltetrahydrofolate cyclohydrolase [Acetobacter lovaniensis]MCI1698417.1 bifunctional methylenetetrahydrofolate dehydrogenase/methenyltetrahydrofolate cyclohydrolase FolD [Acetobacter lovaniensis]MCI1794817.1 bifunctional methylenetetrahydrofolate dehydrogenase/methenyltetrahydrofolate cyclohydrolase FolD [